MSCSSFIPNITGGWSILGATANTVGAAYFGSSSQSKPNNVDHATMKNADPHYSLSLGNAIYGSSQTVQPPAVSSYILIKM